MVGAGILRISVQRVRRGRGWSLRNHFQGEDIPISNGRIPGKLRSQYLLLGQLLECSKASAMGVEVFNLYSGDRMEVLHRRSFIAGLCCRFIANDRGAD